MSDLRLNMALNNYFSNDEWLHEILSFVILLCNQGSLGNCKTTIYKNRSGVYCTDFGSGEIQFDKAKKLYTAYQWFHFHVVQYGEEFAEAYKRNNVSLTFAHVYTTNNMELNKTALMEMPGMCLKKKTVDSFPLCPVEFYKLLFKAHSMYHSDLYILDLGTDIVNHKKAGERLKTLITL